MGRAGRRSRRRGSQSDEPEQSTSISPGRGCPRSCSSTPRSPVDAAFSATLATASVRRALLKNAIPGLSDEAQATLLATTTDRWPAIRDEARRLLDQLERSELRDSDLDSTRGNLAGLVLGGLQASERQLVAELVSPVLTANSSYSAELTTVARQQAATAVAPVTVTLSQGQTIVRKGDPIGPLEIEKIQAFGLTDARVDLAKLAGWALLAILIVGLVLAWIYRFRPGLWHRTNVLVLIGMLLVFTTIALKLTAGRSVLPFFVPTAAAGILIAILLDASAAMVLTAVIAVIGGAVNGNSLEITAYIFLGGMAGIVAVRRGDRLNAFVQAAIAILIVNALVVSTFSLLGERDITGVLQLYAASAASAGGSAIAAVGSFAVIGNLFGILTIFQLLELANPSQPLLRRLLIETPGTYHHSIMVGNLAERAAEAIGADPLITRVAAYYHDVGKLANPQAFIENQASGDNVHDELEPDVSATILKEHVGDGIEIAYRAHLPKPLIAFIPQHHGTAPVELLLRQGPRGGRGTVRRARDSRGPEGGQRRGRAPVPPQRTQAAEPRGGPVDARRRGRGLGPLALVARRAGDPGDGQPDHRRATPGRPVRRVRPDPARPRADPRGVRRPAPRDVPPADRLPADRRSSSSRRAESLPVAGARPSVAGRRAMRPEPDSTPRSIYLGPWRIDITIRPGVPQLVPADRPGPGDRGRPRGGRRSPTGLDRADPVRRRGARRPE